MSDLVAIPEQVSVALRIWDPIYLLILHNIYYHEPISQPVRLTHCVITAKPPYRGNPVMKYVLAALAVFCVSGVISTFAAPAKPARILHYMQCNQEFADGPVVVQIDNVNGKNQARIKMKDKFKNISNLGEVYFVKIDERRSFTIITGKDAKDRKFMLSVFAPATEDGHRVGRLRADTIDGKMTETVHCAKVK